MGDELKPLSEAERDVMQVLWERGPSCVRDVLDDLNSRGWDWAYTTAKTVLDRLEGKGYLRRDRTPPAHIYHPRVTRDELARRRVAELRARLFPGSPAPLVRALVEGGLTREEIAELRASLDEIERTDAR